jgi:hypothetical protein
MADGVIERYLTALTSHDWAAFADCLADEFTRVGPYGDTYTSKPEYVEFISTMLPTLPEYSMEIARITYGDGLAYAELAETVSDQDGPLRTPECITFDLTDDGRIRRIEVYIQTYPRP